MCLAVWLLGFVTWNSSFSEIPRDYESIAVGITIGFSLARCSWDIGLEPGERFWISRIPKSPRLWKWRR